MKIEALSKDMQVRRLTDADLDILYALCSRHELFYQCCPPFVSHASLKDDMRLTPPGKTADDKYYVGFFRSGHLTAVLDLIDGYPSETTAYIGFFMVDTAELNRGLGSRLVGEICGSLAAQGFKTVRLCWAKSNPRAEHFWKKNGFVPVEERTSMAGQDVVAAERTLVSLP